MTIGSVADVRERVRARPFAPLEDSVGVSRAAVAALVRDGARGVEILFIRRAEVLGDPWSGQMAFPGGRKDLRDATLEDTVLRETREEIGLDLTVHGAPIGRLDEIEAMVRGYRMGLVIAPFVFEVYGDPPLEPNAREVAEAIWTPLAPLIDGTAATQTTYVHEGKSMEFPGVRVGEHVVWGLTYRMLHVLFAQLR